MAIGLSGSNGGVQKAYRQFALPDVDAGIFKCKSFYEKIPEKQIGIRDFCTKVISGLRELRKQMVKGLKATV